MKLQNSKRRFTVQVLALLFLVGLGVPSAGSAGYSILHNFGGPPDDGAGPDGSLVQDSTYLYGMTSQGGSSPDYVGGFGVIFKVKKDGTDYVLLHSFGDGSVANDGKGPQGDLTLSGLTLYGMTSAGGSNGGGTIFKINTDGSGYTVLHSFGGYNDIGQFYYESAPLGSLTLVGSTLYGMTQSHGAYGRGVIFKINTDGGDYAVLHTFGDGTVAYDGGLPSNSRLAVYGSTLYGMTAQYGGSEAHTGGGVIFKINTDGTDYAILHRFHDETVVNDGAYPVGGLSLLGSTLYGMASAGGSNGQGVIFRIGTDGSDYTIVHSFCDGSVSYDGAVPWGDLALLGNAFYGMTTKSLVPGAGVIFKINTDGSSYAILHRFPDGSVVKDGASPPGNLIVSGATLFGMTTNGGSSTNGNPNGNGIIFSLTLDKPVWTLYDDFSSGVIDPERWFGSDNGSQLRERSMLVSSKQLNLLERSYGSLDSNEDASTAEVKLTFTNSPKIMGIKALVKPTAYEATGCGTNTAGTSAEASLLCYFFNTDPQGNGSRKNDVFASIGVVRESKSKDAANTGTVIARVGRCQDDTCRNATYLYNKTLGKITTGTSATLSVEWDTTNHKFLFKRDAKSLAFSYDTATYPDESPPAYNNKSLRVDSTVANCQSSPRPTAYIKALYDNVYIKALTP